MDEFLIAKQLKSSYATKYTNIISEEFSIGIDNEGSSDRLNFRFEL